VLVLIEPAASTAEELRDPGGGGGGGGGRGVDELDGDREATLVVDRCVALVLIEPAASTAEELGDLRGDGGDDDDEPTACTAGEPSDTGGEDVGMGGLGGVVDAPESAEARIT
jgi:hypothetical protein